MERTRCAFFFWRYVVNDNVEKKIGWHASWLSGLTIDGKANHTATCNNLLETSYEMNFSMSPWK